QLHSWLQTGTEGPRGSYGERLRFMEMHLQRLVEWRGEHLACLQFRKVATWYSKALRTGKAVQQTLVRLDRMEAFHRVVERLRQAGPPPGWGDSDATSHIPVPAGPIAHW